MLEYISLGQPSAMANFMLQYHVLPRQWGYGSWLWTRTTWLTMLQKILSTRKSSMMSALHLSIPTCSIILCISKAFNQLSCPDICSIFLFTTYLSSFELDWNLHYLFISTYWSRSNNYSMMLSNYHLLFKNLIPAQCGDPN